MAGRLDSGIARATFWVAVLIVCLPACGCGGADDLRRAVPDTAPATLPPSPPLPEPVSVVAGSIDPAGGPRPFRVDTQLIVDQDVAVMTRMTGIVEEIFVDRGSRVARGDPLLRLMNRDLAVKVRKAEIAARQRQADFDRAQRLHAERTISAAQFEEADLALQAAQADIEAAREDLERSFVRAPFDGLIVDRFARVGLRVVEDENQPLFRLTAMSPLQARLYLPEELARSVRRGDAVEVVSRVDSGATTTGSIDWLSPVVDAASGTTQAIVAVRGGGGRAGLFHPGAAVTVVLQQAAPAAGATVPRAALSGWSGSPLDPHARIEVLENGARAWREVQVGGQRGDSVEILSGLRAGERVILDGGAPPATGDGPAHGDRRR